MRWRFAACLAAMLMAAMPAAGTRAVADAGPDRQDAVARVVFAGRPVPGAVVTATRGDDRVATTSDALGWIRLPKLAPGTWNVSVEMTGFESLALQFLVPASGAAPVWTLRMLPIGAAGRQGMPAAGSQTTPAAATVAAPTPARPRPALVPSEPAEEPAAADGFLVNGSVNNAAASPFAQPRGFGNNRPQAASLYTGSFGVEGGTSRWDARPYGFEAGRTTVPDHTNVQMQVAIGGPLKPWFAGRAAPRVFAAYQGSARQTATTQSLLVPTPLERGGDFSRTLGAAGAPVRVVDPLTGEPFGDAMLPASRISPQATALLALYPLPTREAGGRSNYEAPVTSVRRQDDIQTRVTHAIPQNIFLGSFAWQRMRARTRTAFGFEDETRTSGLDALASWNHRFSPRWAMRFRYQHTRLSSEVTPFFAGRVNVSGDAGIAGNDQTPASWGPPRLVFPDMATLSDVDTAASKSVTHGVNVETYLNRGRHTITLGGDVQFNRRSVVSQQDARGTFTFTGAATGVPFADFLLGLPATSAIGAGNPDKRFRSRSFAAYVSDDARIRPTVTLTFGVRWEYDTPFEEADGRLANLDVAPGFSAVQPVTAAAPLGPLTSRHFPSSLVTPDRSAVQPRVAVAWRPIAGSSLTIRAGFGVYRNPGLYAALASVLSQQPPVSRTSVVERSEERPITLADGFSVDGADAAGAFAADPDIRVGYVRTWQVSAVREIPGSLQITASYLGSSGRHLLQQSLPNSYPPGGVNPCPTCPVGFVHLTSGGRSSRHALQVQLRRRLRGGFSAGAQYTFAKAMDDAATFSGGLPAPGSLAQDWQDPRAEWAPSSFDRRHVVTSQAQYTVGAGRGAAARLDGWKGALLKGWTIAGDLSAGSGLPLTAIVLVPIPGTGFVGVRPDLTGAPIDDAPPGRYANPAAFAAPASGQWGTAGRHALRGPAEFRFDMSLARAFAWGDRRTVEWRLDATNVLNRVTFADLHGTVGSPLFGLPSVANPMRRILTSIRVRF
jgi:hypothetical protein